MGDWQNPDESCKEINHDIIPRLRSFENIGASAQYVALLCHMILIALNATWLKV